MTTAAKSQPDAFAQQFALSPAQREIQILAALDPNCAAAFHLMSVVRIKAPPDVAQLRAALRQVVQRHESLRTLVGAGQMEQTVLAAYDPELPLVDFSGQTATAAQAEALQWLKHERVRPFDHDNQPLWRATVLKTGAESHYLVVTAHDLVFDGWSFHILFSEIEACYCGGQAASSLLQNPPLQYQALCRQLEQRRAAVDMESCKAYWLRQHGDGDLPILELPADRRRPHSMTYHGASCSAAIDPPLRAALQDLARSNRCTLFMVLLAGYCALLHRLGSQEKFVLGIDSAGRFSRDAQTVIGNCAVLLPLISELTGSPTVATHLATVREKLVAALAQPDSALAALLSTLKTAVDPLQPIRVNIGFNMQNAPRSSDLFEPALALQAQTRAFSLLDLGVEATEIGETIQLEFVYNKDLFDAARVARIATYYLNLLKGMASMPQSPLHQLPFMPQVEKQTLLVTWNEPSRVAAPAQSFLQLFAAQAARTPGSLAVTTGESSLTYAQLDSHSSQLACRLQAHSGGETAVTALLAERGCDYLVALLGILKANQIYLPLDPRDPHQRLRWTIEQSEAKTILASVEFLPLLAQIVATLAPARRPTIVALAATPPEAPPSSGIAPPAYAPRQPAYVMYTSGSTGTPKGAMVGQAGMVNHLLAKITALGLCAEDVVAHAASQCFDISLWQFLAPLLVGGRVHVLADTIAHDPAQLLPQIDHAKITIFQTVPSMLHAILNDANLYGAARPRLDSLRWLISTGEALPAQLCRRWISHYPRIPLLNAYGPTECSDDVAHHPIHWPPPKEAVHVPIGRPIAGAALYVLDAWQQPVAEGSIGELYIGGVCVGLGYLNDPQRTAAAFVPDPFDPASGARLYRSGDLVKYLPTGELVFIGRRDQQTKVNGVRIELGEIEQTLRQYPSVQDCVVVARQAEGEPAFLAAYVVARPGTAHSGGELLSYLRLHLPQYMIPATFTTLDAIPLTANGKVDRTALPAPLGPPPGADRGNGVAPSTELERAICAIWADILNQSHIGIFDDFFVIGGRSLDAIRVTARINQTFHSKLPVAQIYRAPTVHGIARYLGQAAGTGASL